MSEPCSRRHVLLGGIALLGSACTGRRSSGPRSIPHADEVVGGRPAAATGSLRYVVRPGDTLSSISRRSGVAVGTIIDANRLDSPLIRPGEILVLPGTTAIGVDPLSDELARRERLAQLEAPTSPPPAGSFNLVPRSRWTTQAVGKNHQGIGSVTRITIHHTSEHPGMVGLSDLEIIRRIERYHRETRKWSSIGYHYLIGGDGTVYEGRPATIQGAHVSGANEHNIGISCIGDFHRARPPARQLDALHAFLDDRRRRYGVSKGKTYGHRDLGKSICPGNALYEWLQGWKRA